MLNPGSGRRPCSSWTTSSGRFGSNWIPKIWRGGSPAKTTCLARTSSDVLVTRTWDSGLAEWPKKQTVHVHFCLKKEKTVCPAFRGRKDRLNRCSAGSPSNLQRPVLFALLDGRHRGIQMKGRMGQLSGEVLQGGLGAPSWVA